jgi:hypothetical protein
MNLSNFSIITSRRGLLPPENDYARRYGALPYIRARAPLREAQHFQGMVSAVQANDSLNC